MYTHIEKQNQKPLLLMLEKSEFAVKKAGQFMWVWCA